MKSRLLSLFAIVVGGSAIAHAQLSKINEYALPINSQPRNITVGSDGALWFADSGANRGIGRITANGVLNNYPNSGANGGITAGPDGALWFTEWSGGFSNDLIGRLSTAGVLTEYPLPRVNAFPSGITVGPDGALWFTEYTANKIGRITTGGAVTEYPIPTAASNPAEITAGPDGALWFTESATTKVGRITTGGVVTEYAVPSFPWGITRGPDGALWFTEPAGMIARITTSGVVTQYPITTPAGQPLEIIAGPSGALWFTEENADKIGFVTTNGVVTEYSVPTAGSQPYGIALGQDGAIWFTESNGNKIGQAVLNGPPCSQPTTISIDDSGAAGLISATASAIDSNNGALTAKIKVQNPLRFWLSLGQESAPADASLVPDVSAGAEGVAAALGFMAGSGGGFATPCGSPAFVLGCPNPGGAAFAVRFCSPGAITLVYGETPISAGVSIIDALAPVPPSEALTLLTNLNTVPDWVSLTACLAKPGTGTPVCVFVRVLDLITNNDQRNAVASFFEQAGFSVGVNSLLGLLGAGETYEDFVAFAVRTTNAGHPDRLSIRIVAN